MEHLEDKKIILFDGVCNLCNSTVNFVIERDKKDVFRFASLQSDIGKKLLSERNIDPSVTDSIVLIEPNVAYYVKSSAALEIAKEIGGFWSVLGVFNYILPESLRDALYNFIARNRYKWFGKKEGCPLPTPELKAKFLDQYP
ncbi:MULTISPECIES: thiol-disulfide oxidoreductase DCC family protein [Galbibacter]|uniref:Thiol-disulfide oxidoreductase DCC family protein n=1 Tax=Galbibacter pacificus TaxID=2996052 RepID=A0ABT6FPJ6_9FLAO|nr:thiol-disulfide oxidoreductase DCC family protein [Galbibacter pacificus]MDG3582332.1 thiol-disulfide oxidoreductase DCC family protein [Galbibacter pacificus]MDG3585192.1 thiol-disulfide oxidoreductase DCC family protein [Galbibacter pacificus]